MTKELLPKLPEFKVNPSKNGYEIRTEILEMAKELVFTEFQYKWNGWELTAERDDKSGQIITKVGMPEFPGLSQVLETAEKMYGFVNVNNQTRK